MAAVGTAGDADKKGGAEIESVRDWLTSAGEEKVSLLTVFHTDSVSDASTDSHTDYISNSSEQVCVSFLHLEVCCGGKAGQVWFDTLRAAQVASELTSTNHEQFRYGAFNTDLHICKHKCDRGTRYGAFHIASRTSRHHHDSGANNSSPHRSRLSSCSSGYCSHPADGSCFELPALPVPLPQQRRLQDDRGAGSG